VVLTTEEQWDVARMIARELSPLGLTRHLVLLPLSVLLENLAGVYVGLMLGAEVIVPSLAEVGLTGSSGFCADIALDAIDASSAQSVILLPEMLRQMVVTMKRTHRRLKHLRFIAVGGGKVPPCLIREARALGLPVFEGYGLSELGSVVSLNRPGADRLGSVGRPLEGRTVHIADDGEILVRGFGSEAFIATGDLGFLDSDGFLFVSGRKKNLLITGFGRNVSPEWPESVLLQSPEIAQVLVYGDGDPQLSALIVPVSRGLNQEATSAGIAAEIARLNLELPDYAQICHWRLLSEPFTVHNGLATANGRLRRDAIFERYLSQPLLTQGALA
jgi:long-subunit acyl-CoA synthetase (AMP-forming)